MYDIIHFILKDRNTGLFSFKPFSLCHILYLLIIITLIVLVLLLCKKKNQEFKIKIVDISVDIALGLYILDFFLMPLAYGEISIIKLPFHLCTLMSIMIFLARHTKFWSKYKESFTLLGMIGSLMYLCYPAGVQNPAGEFFDGYTYRIIQTILYHGIMLAQGVFAIVYGDIKLNWNEFKNDIIIILFMIIWATIGNSLFTGTEQVPCGCFEGCTEMITIYSIEPNWFFVQHDALYIIPDDIDGYIAPFMMIFGIGGMCALVRFLSLSLLKVFKKENIA